MRFSAITALCAAPLALASTLQADLAARGAVGVEVSESSQGSSSNDGSRDSSSSRNNNNYNNNNYNSNNNNDHNNDNNIIEETNINEVIIIWVNEGGGAATSTVTNTVTVTAGGSTGTSAALATHSVTVGGSAGLVYSPDTIEAAVGDMVIFTFESQNHTVTQSAFTTPCEALSGGKNSGFMANVNNTVSPAPQMAMQVTVATPIWFYCQQKGHCGKGMTFSINPTANKTQAMFQQMAIAQNGTGTAAPITGGSSSAVAPPPSANTVASSSSAGSTGLTQGSGSVNSGGSCECSCLCGVSAFPSADVQGIGGYGGMSGAMPMSSLES